MQSVTFIFFRYNLEVCPAQLLLLAVSQLVGPSLKGLAPVICNWRETLIPLLGLGFMVGSQVGGKQWLR